MNTPREPKFLLTWKEQDTPYFYNYINYAGMRVKVLEDFTFEVQNDHTPIHTDEDGTESIYWTCRDIDTGFEFSANGFALNAYLEGSHYGFSGLLYSLEDQYGFIPLSISKAREAKKEAALAKRKETIAKKKQSTLPTT